MVFCDDSTFFMDNSKILMLMTANAFPQQKKWKVGHNN